MRSTDYSEALVVEKFFGNTFQQVITTKSKLLDVTLTNNTDPVLNVSVDNKVNTLYKSNHLQYRRSFQDEAGTEQNSNGRQSRKTISQSFLHTS